MKPNLFQAIDLIGDRLAARLDWETMSGLPWAELQPFLVAAPGKLALEVLDPDDSSQRLAVWAREDALAILESQEIPAHRIPKEIEVDACILHRLNIAKLAADLADPIGFIPSPTKHGKDFHRIGIVQVPNRGIVEVFLLVPQTPGTAKIAAHRLATARGEKGQTIVLLPSVRWTTILPAFPPSFEVRVLAEFFQTENSDSLLAVAADTAPKQKSKLKRPAKSLPVKLGDKWSDVTATFDPGNGMLELRIESRHFSVRVWDTRKEEPSKAAFIIGKMLHNHPHSWSVSEYSGRNQAALRRAFQRFQKQLASWAPIQGDEPFLFESATNTHFPKFRLIQRQS